VIAYEDTIAGALFNHTNIDQMYGGNNKKKFLYIHIIFIIKIKYNDINNFN